MLVGNTLPRTPDLYALELFGTNIRHDGLDIARETLVTEMPPELLQEDPHFDSKYYPAHLGEIAEPLVAMPSRPPAEQRLDTLQKGAAFVAMLEVTDTMALRVEGDEVEKSAKRATFLENTKAAFFGANTDTMPESLDTEHEYQLYTFAGRVGTMLGVNSPTTEEAHARHNTLDTLFDERNSILLEHFAESQPEARDPEKLLGIAKQIGALTTEISFVALADMGQKDFERIRELARFLGEVGGVEDHFSQRHPETDDRQTFRSVLEQQFSTAAVGRREAHRMRNTAQAESYRNAQALTTTRRERSILRTEAFFISAAYALKRAKHHIKEIRRQV